MKPSNFSIGTSADKTAVRVFYNGYAVVRLSLDGLHRVFGQPSAFPINPDGQIRVRRYYQYNYYHDIAWSFDDHLETLALGGEVAELSGWKFILRPAGEGVALCAILPHKTAYTLFVINSTGLSIAGGCGLLKKTIALNNDYSLRVWRN